MGYNQPELVLGRFAGGLGVRLGWMGRSQMPLDKSFTSPAFFRPYLSRKADLIAPTLLGRIEHLVRCL